MWHKGQWKHFITKQSRSESTWLVALLQFESTVSRVFCAKVYHAIVVEVLLIVFRVANNCVSNWLLGAEHILYYCHIIQKI